MYKFNRRFHAIIAAIIFAFVMSCTVPAQAVPTPDDPVEAAACFIQAVKLKKPTMLNYFDSATKNNFASSICQEGGIGKEGWKAVRASLDNPNSEAAKAIASGVGSNPQIQAQYALIDVNAFRSKAKAKIQGNKAYIGDKTSGQIVLVHEPDGWKLAPQYFVK